MYRVLPAAALAAVVSSGSAIAGPIYDLSWNATVFTWTLDNNVPVLDSPGMEFSASGFVEFDEAGVADDTFDINDVIDFGLTVDGKEFVIDSTGTSFGGDLSFTYDFDDLGDNDVFEGVLNSDGSALISDIFLVANNDEYIFGCNSFAGDCGITDGINILASPTFFPANDPATQNLPGAIYDTPLLARESFELTLREVAPIPVPAGLPLLLAGLGGFALLRRKKG
ncbi:MAG: VPLPA-CTERM sorting domain-containing protein [Pseudomonadota bacterium]